jgi:hypothetical protein
VPTHFTLAAGGDELLLHLARPNPVWPHLEAAAEVRLAVIGDYAYVPTYWRAKAGGPEEHGVPTSYYSAVQFVCRPTVVDDPQGKAAILATQLADFQPEGATQKWPSTPRRTHGCCPAAAVCGLRCCGWRPSSSTTMTSRSSTANASPTTSNNATRASTPEPLDSNGGAWTRSVTGRPTGPGHDQTPGPATAPVPAWVVTVAAMLPGQLGAALPVGFKAPAAPARPAAGGRRRPSSPGQHGD